jgi:hypothetical protein
MFKIVMVVLCVLLMIGMLATDFFISRDIDRFAKKMTKAIQTTISKNCFHKRNVRRHQLNITLKCTLVLMPARNKTTPSKNASAFTLRTLAVFFTILHNKSNRYKNSCCYDVEQSAASLYF